MKHQGDVQSKGPMKVGKSIDNIAPEHSRPQATAPIAPISLPIMSLQIVTEIERKKLPKRRSYRTAKRSRKNINKI